ncbi:MAG: glycosyltransferase [Spirochaetales bacterium]|nr:glycosyltransferase [Spirochaetales bacterium]
MEPVNPALSVVLPVHNEENHLEEAVSRIIVALDEPEVILVDDGSLDHSFTLMKSLADRYLGVRVLRLDGNYGQQNATLAGLLYARGGWVCTMDADLQHPPEALPVLLAAAAEGADVVYGVSAGLSRKPLRRLGSGLRDLVFRAILKKPAGLRLSSFRVIRGEVIHKLRIPKFAFVYVSAELLTVTRRIVSVPVYMNPSPHKTGGYSFGALARLLVNVVIHYGALPGLKKHRLPGPPYRISEVYPCA